MLSNALFCSLPCSECTLAPVQGLSLYLFFTQAPLGISMQFCPLVSVCVCHSGQVVNAKLSVNFFVCCRCCCISAAATIGFLFVCLSNVCLCWQLFVCLHCVCVCLLSLRVCKQAVCRLCVYVCCLLQYLINEDFNFKILKIKIYQKLILRIF